MKEIESGMEGGLSSGQWQLLIYSNLNLNKLAAAIVCLTSRPPFHFQSPPSQLEIFPVLSGWDIGVGDPSPILSRLCIQHLSCQSTLPEPNLEEKVKFSTFALTFISNFFCIQVLKKKFTICILSCLKRKWKDLFLDRRPPNLVIHTNHCGKNLVGDNFDLFDKLWAAHTNLCLMQKQFWFVVSDALSEAFYHTVLVVMCCAVQKNMHKSRSIYFG